MKLVALYPIDGVMCCIETYKSENELLGWYHILQKLPCVVSVQYSFQYANNDDSQPWIEWILSYYIKE